MLFPGLVLRAGSAEHDHLAAGVRLCSALAWGPLGPVDCRGGWPGARRGDLAIFWQSLLGNSVQLGSHVGGKISSRLTFLRL